MFPVETKDGGVQPREPQNNLELTHSSLPKVASIK
jgi:hypothetical protein